MELVESGARAATVIDRGGRRLAALVHDASLREDPELLDAVTAAAGIALENAQQRLVALSLELGMLQKRFSDDPEAKDRLERSEVRPRSAFAGYASSRAGFIPRWSPTTA